jgi:hypothetical protein
MVTPTEQSGIKLRRATRDDFDALHIIWMQDHINPFMSFEQMPKEQFRPIFEDLFNSSDVELL